MTQMGVFAQIMNYSSDLPTSVSESALGRASSDAAVEKDKPVTGKKSDMLLYEIGRRNFNLDQMEPILKRQGNQLIISGAGSGKTTVLIFKILYDQTTGEMTRLVEINGNPQRVLDRVLVATFLKTGADELKSRYRKWTRELGLPDMSNFMQFKTLHAEFKAALESMGLFSPIIDGSTNFQLMKKAINQAQTYSGKRLNSEDYKNLETALTKTRNALGPDKYVNSIYEALDLSEIDVKLIISNWRQLRKEEGKMDFEDLQEVLWDLVCVRKDEKAIEIIQNRYNYFFVDEFQDTSEIQYQILKVYFSKAKKITVIGDDDQCIYGWRGSETRIITEDFPKDWEHSQMSLDVNYRCPDKVLTAVIPSINRNKMRYPKNLRASREGGKLRVGYFSNQRKMADRLVELLNQDQQNGETSTILVRVNTDGFLPALMLAKHTNIKFSLSNSRMTFESPFGRLAKYIPSILKQRSGTSVSVALKELVWEKEQVNTLMRICKAEKKFFWELDKQDLIYSMPHLAKCLFEIEEGIDGKDEIQALRFLYGYFISEYLNATRMTSYIEASVGTLSAVLNFLELGDYPDVMSFLDDLEELTETLRYAVGASKAPVRIATVHEFKGKEDTNVYVWNDSEGMFPHQSSMETMKDLEEERRVHYIACTRPSSSLTLLSQRNRTGMFLQEMDLSAAEDITDVGEESIRIGKS